jgi:Plavaka transposase
VAPVIIATDKTQLTQFSGNKSAYPVYLTIGNIPRATRRKPSKHACVLIAYLSVEKIDRSRMNDQEHRSRVQRLFHESMRIVLEPLINAGTVGVEMTSSDGAVRRVHPILTCYVADYPEQCLVACTKYGTCVKCQASANDLQNPTPAHKRTQKWTEDIIAKGMEEANGNANKFHSYCMSNDVAGSVYKPFWVGFPFCDIHRAITPDVLHQLYQGVFKHVVSWCQKILSPQALDRRIRALPPAYGLRQFKNGISALSQISGPERKNMAKILLGCLVGSIPSQGIAAITALLDFIYIAQYSAHDTTTLGYLQDALDRFHKNRSYFISTLVREHFNIPKFHSLLHYIEAIELFGTTDNYNTEMFECLHIDFAKHGWRASNQRDEFPQMIRWLSRQEKIASFEVHLPQPQVTGNDARTLPKRSSMKKSPISIAKHPSFPNRQLSLIEEKHHAPDFTYHLKVFLSKLLSKPIQNRHADDIPLPFTKVDVYNMFRFHPEGIQDNDEENDLVKALPRSAQNPHSRFDTVIAIVDDEAESTGVVGELTSINESLC